MTYDMTGCGRACLAQKRRSWPRICCLGGDLAAQHTCVALKNLCSYGVKLLKRAYRRDATRETRRGVASETGYIRKCVCTYIRTSLYWIYKLTRGCPQSIPNILKKYDTLKKTTKEMLISKCKTST